MSTSPNATAMTAALVSPATTVLAAAGAAAIALHFHTDARALFGCVDGEFSARPWSLLTCHFVHLNGRHLAANLLALTLLCWTAAQARCATELPLAMLAAMLAVSIGLVVGPFAIAWYVGLSGVLYGLFAHLAVRFGADRRPLVRWLGIALAVTGAVKVVADLSGEVGAIGALGIPTAAPAHLYGYLGGTLSALAMLSRRRS